VLTELIEFRDSIKLDLYAPGWSRCIGLIINRDPTITLLTDASSNGLGGWSADSELSHMWRITVGELVTIGLIQAQSFDNPQYHEPEIDPHQFHINILEFVAIFIELWIYIRQLQQQTPPPGGHRILCLADNTSAVSWLRYATRTRRPPIRRLARMLQAFLAHDFSSNFIRVQGKHLPGINNECADNLSRFENHPSWVSVMQSDPRLTNLPICPVPSELLSIIVSLLTKRQTEDWFAEKMTRLWTIALPIFVTGLNRMETTPGKC
jgi:hypothetical protein